MAKSTYAPMFSVVSGALNKINKKSPHAADQKMVLTTHRKAPTTSDSCSRVYLRDINSVTRSTPVSNDERDLRTKFAYVSQAVSARMKDITKKEADEAAFKAQKDEAGGKKTMRAYLWSVISDEYDAQHQG